VTCVQENENEQLFCLSRKWNLDALANGMEAGNDCKDRAQGLDLIPVTTSGGIVSTEIDVTNWNDQQQVQFYRSLFSMANVDGHLDESEVSWIGSFLEASKLSPESRQTILEAAGTPPPLGECLTSFASSSEKIRTWMFEALVQVAYADEQLKVEELAAVEEAQKILGISDEERARIVREIRLLLAGDRKTPGASGTQRCGPEAKGPWSGNSASWAGLSNLKTVIASPIVALVRMGGLGTQSIRTALAQLGSLVGGGLSGGMGVLISFGATGEAASASLDALLEGETLKDPRLIQITKRVRDLNGDIYESSTDRHLLASIEQLTDDLGKLLKSERTKNTQLDAIERDLNEFDQHLQVIGRDS